MNSFYLIFIAKYVTFVKESTKKPHIYFITLRSHRVLFIL